MDNVIDITTELAYARSRPAVVRIGRMTADRRAEILADPIQAVAEVEQCYSSEIVRLRKAMREACRAMQRQSRHCGANDDGGEAGANAAERILCNAIAMPWNHERG